MSANPCCSNSYFGGCMAFTFFLVEWKVDKLFLKNCFWDFGDLLWRSYALFSLAGVFVLLYSNFFGEGKSQKKRPFTLWKLKEHHVKVTNERALIWADEGHETLKRSLTNKLYLSLIQHVTIVNNHYIILFLTMYYIKKYVRVKKKLWMSWFELWTVTQCLKITLKVVFECFNFGIFHQILAN